MLKKVKTNEGIQYQKLSPEEMKARGILGRLVGPCADFYNPTRNGRKYSEQLWENVFNNPIMQEKIKNGVCFGELGHPTDRTEIDMEKIAVCLREQPVKNDKGQLCAVLDILDTPNGRILKTLCDYGSTVGISSRGQGDLITDINGDEAVDPDTYECECFDIVLVPAVESARLKYVNESLDTNKINMRKALKESLDSASDEDKKVMTETLKQLHIKLNESDAADDYKKEAEQFIKDIETMPIDEVSYYYNTDFDFPNHAPEDDVEEKIYAALKARLDLSECKELTEEKEEDKAEEEISEEDAVEEIDEPEAEEPVEELASEEEQPEVEASEEAKEEESADEAAGDKDAEEAEITEKSEEEIFLDYLKANFNEEQIKNACKALDIEVPEADEADGLEEKPVEGEEEIEEVGAAEESSTAEDDNKECDSESCADTDESKEGEDKVEEATDDGDEALVKTLQEALKTKSTLENNVKDLQEKLAVSDTKVNELNEEINKQKKAIARLAGLSKANKDLKDNVSALEESLKSKDATIEEQKTRIARLVKSNKQNVSESLSLNESVKAQTTQVETLTESLNKANEEVKALKEQAEKSNNSVKELTENLNKTTSLKEAYKKLANNAVNKYIEVKARTYGLTATDIKRKLGESYSLSDVDQVCEDLKAYQLNVSKLPFNVGGKVGVRVNEGSQRLPQNKRENDDDDVDESLIKLANLN